MNSHALFNLAISLATEVDSSREGFPDSAIALSFKKRKLGRIAFGIDIGIGEIIAAKNLSCDAVVSHHPFANALQGIHKELLFQKGNLSHYGVPGQKISDQLTERSLQEKRSAMGYSLCREIEIARLYEIEFICIHTPLDIIGADLIRSNIEKSSCHKLKDLINTISAMPEFRSAKKFGQSPFIANGKPGNGIGNISYSEFIGGEEGALETFRLLREAGIDTIMVPHLSEEYFKEAVKAGLNIIYRGHYASDSVGMNLLINKMVAEDNNVKIVSIGGLIRD